MEAVAAMIPSDLALYCSLLVGVIAAWKLLGVVSTLYAFFIRPGKNLRKYGEWAVVTGATDGIGEAMAFEMARKGLSILLVSRTQSKLDDTMGRISAKHPKVGVRTLAIDFSNFDKAAQAKVKAAIKDLDVGVLVNNVGVSYSFCRYFHELSEEEVDGLVELNVNSTTRMTYLVLDGMLERKRGAIVNMSSAATRNPSPLLAGYAGAKGFVDHFSESLHHELKGKRIHVQVQNPLFVVSKLSKIKKASISTPTPSAYARCAVAHIGYESQVSPYWAHALQIWLTSIAPESVVQNAIVLPMHFSIRKRGFKKLEAKNKAN